MTEYPEKDEQEGGAAEHAAAKMPSAKTRRPWYKTLFSRKANIFVKAARTLTLAFTGLWAAEASLPYVLDGRPLHDNETKMLQQMGYDDSIDYSKVKIHASAFGDFYLDMMKMGLATKGSMVIVPQAEYAEDFTQKSTVDEFFFVHELGHVWQNQNNVIFSRLHAAKDMFNYFVMGGDGSSHYEYKLEEGKDLMDYGLEQQPTILADFNQLIRHGERPLMAGLDFNDDFDKEELEAQYRSVLKNFLDSPDYARNRAFQPWR
ncbi:MAG: hypothetical protein HND56_08980 [Pseudomonadota bacterium]|nr:hypothetical protein [Pseudomonadota bacterium]QKK05813.1 MAG: hypothetical protein HND56_08980 [Pseudomonadota bacterium]